MYSSSSSSSTSVTTLALTYLCCFNIQVRNAFIPNKRRIPISSHIKFQTNNNNNNMNKSSTATKERKKQKQVVLIRHGCTYMNEYLSQKGCQWGDPYFTDVFPVDDTRDAYYLDTPLSKRGRNQAQRLLKQCTTHPDTLELVRDLELIVVSPLTRALQTLEIGLYPAVQTQNQQQLNIVALPLAAERLYLISDVGKSTSTLEKSFPFVDFETGFEGRNREQWWFTPDEKVKEKYYYEIPCDDNEDNSQTAYETYKEWRPNTKGQTYAVECGEPEEIFENRMYKLIQWIDSREEQTIVLICHWGVIRWLTDGDDFDNCEIKAVPFDFIKNLIRSDTCL